MEAACTRFVEPSKDQTGIKESLGLAADRGGHVLCLAIRARPEAIPGDIKEAGPGTVKLFRDLAFGGAGSLSGRSHEPGIEPAGEDSELRLDFVYPYHEGSSGPWEFLLRCVGKLTGGLDLRFPRQAAPLSGSMSALHLF